MKRSGPKLLCILLLLSLLLSLTACGKQANQLEKTAGYLQAQIAAPGTGSRRNTLTPITRMWKRQSGRRTEC